MVVIHQYRFGEYKLDGDGGLLFRNGQRIVLTPKIVDLLLALVEADGKPLSKDELLQKVWPNTIVEEGSLTSHISLLRKALGEAEGQHFIETIPKRGYRFIGPLIQVAEPSSETGAARRMLVVLPFENLSGNEKYDYFSDGLTEEMISQLARLSPEDLGVIARTSAMQYKSTSKTVQEIGRELNVSHVLEGSIRRADERVRITAQLVRASDESHLWGGTYEQNVHDILTLQGEVARAIAREIRVKLTVGAERRLNSSPSIDPLAHEAYLKGRHFWYKRTEVGMRKSIELFQSAIEHEPNYAAAYDGVSDAYTMLACRGIEPVRETFHKAKAAARRALQIDPELGESYASLAHVRLHDWDWVSLEEDFQRAIDLDPGYAIAHYWYAEYLMAMGRCDESVERVKQSQQLDPVNSVLNASVGMILYLARRYDQAMEELHRALEIDPNHFLLHFRLGLVHQQKGMAQKAIEEMRIAVNLSGRSTESLTGLAQTYAAADEKKHMQEIVGELVSLQGQRYVSPYNMARVYGSSKHQEQCLAWLEKAYEEHNPDLIELRAEPTFDSIRTDARFASLLRRVGWQG